MEDEDKGREGGLGREAEASGSDIVFLSLIRGKWARSQSSLLLLHWKTII